MKYIAYCTKGLEKIGSDEITFFLPDARIITVADKRILFETDADFVKLTGLHTVDDIGIFLQQADAVRSIADIQKIVADIDFLSAKNVLKNYREVKNAFSITTSIVGSPIKSQELTDGIFSFLQEKYAWECVPFDHTNFDIRIFIDHKICIVSVRLTKESLYKRGYKTDSRIGALKPTIAASLVLLATKQRENKKLVDNFCGSGTILCEALSLGNEICGGDIVQEAVVITKINLKNLGFTKEENIKMLDATKPTWQENYFDAAVSNVPWDKQIPIKSMTSLYRDTLQEYKRILKTHGSLCLLVSKPELLTKYARQLFPGSQISQYKIGLLGQNPTIVLVDF